MHIYVQIINAERLSAVTANANTSHSLAATVLIPLYILAFVDFNAHFDTNEAIERHQLWSVRERVFLWVTIYTSQDDFKKILHGGHSVYIYYYWNEFHTIAQSDNARQLLLLLLLFSISFESSCMRTWEMWFNCIVRGNECSSTANGVCKLAQTVKYVSMHTKAAFQRINLILPLYK